MEKKNELFEWALAAIDIMLETGYMEDIMEVMDEHSKKCGHYLEQAYCSR